MKISLTNFKCHENNTFDIPDSGLILLSGESGAGKSTILTAFYYALYGKIRKPFSHGKKTCKVEVEYKNMNITRSYPAKLVVVYNNKTYEDDSAQGIIDNTIGMDHTEFLASSYVIQNKGVSILTMTPGEQIEFIQNLSFSTSSEKVDQIKDSIKDSIRKLTDEKKAAENRIPDLEKELQDLISYSSQTSSTEEKRMYVPSEQVKKNLSETNDKIKVLNSDLDILKQKIDHARKNESSQKENIELLKKISMELSFMENKMLETQEQILFHRKELNPDIDFLREAFSFKQNEENINEQKQRYVSMENELKKETQERLSVLKTKIFTEEDIQKIKKEIKKLKENLEKISSSVQADNAKESLVNIKSWVSDLFGYKSEDANNILTFLRKKRKCIDLSSSSLNKGTHVKCPECYSGLKIYKDCIFSNKNHPQRQPRDAESDLVLADMESFDLFSEKIQQLEKIIEVLKEIVPDENSSECIKKIETFEKNLLKNDYNMEEIISLENKISSGIYEETFSMKTINNKIKSLKEKEETFSKDCVSKFGSIEKQELVNQIEQYDKLELKIKSLEKEYKTYHEKKIAIEKNINDKKKDLDTNNNNNSSIENLEKQRDSTSVDRENLLNKVTELMDLYNYSLNYEKEQLQVLKIRNMEEQLSELKLSLKTLVSKIEGFVGLEKACKEAEILSLERVISSINEHAKFYLEKMFTDEIILRLESIKTTVNNKSKLQINCYLEYRNQVYDSINDLSGGEKQRCELAFLLAVNDIIGSNILMLDECLNNLDASINTEVLTFLRELSENKMMLVVSHEAVKGVFDHEIHV